jgi:hypothetical protein
MNTSLELRAIKLIGVTAIGAAMAIGAAFALPGSAFASTGDSHASDSSWNGNSGDWQNNADGNWQDTNRNNSDSWSGMGWSSNVPATWWSDCTQNNWTSHKDWWNGMGWSQWSSMCTSLQHAQGAWNADSNSNDWNWQNGSSSDWNDNDGRDNWSGNDSWDWNNGSSSDKNSGGRSDCHGDSYNTW